MPTARQQTAEQLQRTDPHLRGTRGRSSASVPSPVHAEFLQRAHEVFMDLRVVLDDEYCELHGGSGW